MKHKFFTNKYLLLGAVAVLVSGFFVAYNALAEHTAHVELTLTDVVDTAITAVDIEQEFNASFAVTRDSGSQLGAIKIYLPSGFVSPTSVTCPEDFTTMENNSANGYVKCAMGDNGDSIGFGTVMLTGLQAINTAGNYNFTVEVSDVDFDKTNLGADITVKDLSASLTSLTPNTTDVDQSRTYTLSITNNGTTPVDSIVEINGTVADFNITACSAEGWETCTPTGSNFTLSDGSLMAGGNMNISLTGTAPASSGNRVVSTTVTGALGGTQTADNTLGINVQTPASLTINSINSDELFVSKNETATNTAVITANVSNSGETTANNLVKTLSILDNEDNDITEQFTLTANDSVETIGTEAQELSWTVVVKSDASYEGLAQAVVAVDYDDVNDQNLDANVNETNNSIFTVDSTAPSFAPSLPAAVSLY